jgi:hypothetical protein
MSIALLGYTAREQRELIGGILSIALGVLIFMFSRLLNYVVAAYFVLAGILLILAATA